MHFSRTKTLRQLLMLFSWLSEKQTHSCTTTISNNSSSSNPGKLFALVRKKHNTSLQLHNHQYQQPEATADAVWFSEKENSSSISGTI